ncbi:hypothetical protein ACFX2I_026608 [Malus domestica]
MNQLQSELRLARSLIAERDSEIQQVQTTNNQYVEENERLRAILGEWSTRAAKVLSSNLGQSSWGIIFCNSLAFIYFSLEKKI